jgi:hypothetical protein
MAVEVEAGRLGGSPDPATRTPQSMNEHQDTDEGRESD